MSHIAPWKFFSKKKKRWLSAGAAFIAIHSVSGSAFKNEVQAVKDGMQTVKNEVQAVKDDLQTVKNEVKTVKNELQTVKNDLQTTKNDLQTVKGEVHQIKLCQENIIMPRLNTIESCYTDTFDRYKKYADKMDASFDDIELLKNVVSEHSVKLHKLA